MVEDFETEITLKPIKQTEQEDAEQIIIPKKKTKPQVVEEEFTEFTITKEVGY